MTNEEAKFGQFEMTFRAAGELARRSARKRPGYTESRDAIIGQNSN
jgi:hypothetical protein